MSNMCMCGAREYGNAQREDFVMVRGVPAKPDMSAMWCICCSNWTNELFATADFSDGEMCRQCFDMHRSKYGRSSGAEQWQAKNGDIVKVR